MDALKNQTVVSVTSLPDVDSLCSRAVQSAVEVFVVEGGNARIPNDTCPLAVLFGTLRKITAAFDLDVAPGLDLNSQASLHRILQANFDTNTQGFLEQETSDIFAHLTCAQKARILAQAIAVATTIFRRLAETGSTITPGVLNREAQLFAESEHRGLMQNAIEESPVFEQCEGTQQIADAIFEAMEVEQPSLTPTRVAADDKLEFMFSPSAGQERPKNMGLPWGFSIMALN